MADWADALLQSTGRYPLLPIKPVALTCLCDMAPDPARWGFQRPVYCCHWKPFRDFCGANKSGRKLPWGITWNSQISMCLLFSSIGRDENSSRNKCGTGKGAEKEKQREGAEQIGKWMKSLSPSIANSRNEISTEEFRWLCLLKGHSRKRPTAYTFALW